VAEGLFLGRSDVTSTEREENIVVRVFFFFLISTREELTDGMWGEKLQAQKGPGTCRTVSY
jgi:hypothetical protein